MKEEASKKIVITAVGTHESKEILDTVAIEAPLSITLQSRLGGKVVQKPFMVTMRSPGDDFDLVRGLLWSEDVIQRFDDLIDLRYTTSAEHVIAHLSPESYRRVHDRVNFEYVSRSACGICGKESIDDIYKHSCYMYVPAHPLISHASLLQLSKRLFAFQKLFNQTGGVHAAGLFNPSGQIILAREDIGRHSAVDKLIGAALTQGLIPMSNYGIIVSGRASFELVQKTWMAGAPFLVAVGPPSNLGVELATDSGMTLVGFLSDVRYNIYTHPKRVRLE